MAPWCLLGSPLISKGRERSLPAWRTTKASARPSPKPLQQLELRFSVDVGAGFPMEDYLRSPKCIPWMLFLTLRKKCLRISKTRDTLGRQDGQCRNVPKR